jgi:salicylate hydroxylase
MGSFEVSYWSRRTSYKQSLHATSDKRMTEPRPIDVAIIDGGITALALAFGLQRRGIPFHIYERAQNLREIEAGIAFIPNAERAMKILDPRIHKSFKSVAVQNASDWVSNGGWLQWRQRR